MPLKVLLIGDKVIPARGALAGEFSVRSCHLAREAFEALHLDSPDLVLMDLDLADMDGLSFLSALRETEHGAALPVLVVSSGRAEDAILRAFELGAEDHLAAPFDSREVAARIRAILRRRSERLEPWGPSLELAGVAIDPSARGCLAFGRRVELQPREFELLEALMRRAGRVLSRGWLLETIWGMDRSARTRAVDVMVSRLRRKLGPRAGRRIATVSKMGYCFRPR